jgi:deoxyribodipyrimidine photo-lyase
MRLPAISPLRVVPVTDRPMRPEGTFVLYWMTSARRLEWNFGLDRAVGWAQKLGKPLLILEALRARYPWASERLHRFCLDGMAEHRRRLAGGPVGYHPYAEPRAGAGKGLLRALAGDAAVVVTDEFPTFFLPRMLAAAGTGVPVLLEAVDSNGILPLRVPDREFGTAQSFRRFLQGVLTDHLENAPLEEPLRAARVPDFPGVPPAVLARWPAVSADLLEPKAGFPAEMGLGREVPPIPFRGGRTEGRARLDRFLATGLQRYAEDARHPDRDGRSRLSPYLHWGHVGTHEVVHEVLDREGWRPAASASPADGRRVGWWGLSPGAEAFLDQLITWRELGYQTAHRLGEEAEAYRTLPAWARKTLDAHRSDPRPHLYPPEAFEKARTHDPVWNAAQRELRRDGTIHNSLRMLWGKKILEWSRHPEDAMELMLHLNNRWGIDGRNPNSISGIAWTLGRYDRGWPERPVFGTVRSMSSARTRRKLEMERYLERFSAVED